MITDKETNKLYLSNQLFCITNNSEPKYKEEAANMTKILKRNNIEYYYLAHSFRNVTDNHYTNVRSSNLKERLKDVNDYF